MRVLGCFCKKSIEEHRMAAMKTMNRRDLCGMLSALAMVAGAGVAGGDGVEAGIRG
jgi:hypothetical protein